MPFFNRPFQPWPFFHTRQAQHGVSVLGVTLVLLLSGCTDVEGLKVVPRPDLSDSDSSSEDNDQTTPGDRRQGNDGGNNGNNSPEELQDTGDPFEEVDTGDAPSMPEDDAELVWVDLPTHLNCSESYIATVEMRNIGTNTWTRADGYKLGAVNDSDSLYGPDTRVWLPESVAIAPGESHMFDFVMQAPEAAASYLTDWQMVHEGVRWFGESTTEAVAVTCSQAQTTCDPLTQPTLESGFANKSVQGGSFSASGWQTTSGSDQLVLELASGVSSSGSLEVDVTNFSPTTQYSRNKHQVLNMYTSDNGSQDVFASTEAWWNIRTGTNYGTGFKVLAAPHGGNSREEARIMQNASWNPSDTYRFSVVWDSQTIQFYLDGTLVESLPFHGQTDPMQHVFIGKDNVYDGQIGPIYSNLCVTRNT